jgi:hypothetical protein
MRVKSEVECRGDEEGEERVIEEACLGSKVIVCSPGLHQQSSEWRHEIGDGTADANDYAASASCAIEE